MIPHPHDKHNEKKGRKEIGLAPSLPFQTLCTNNSMVWYSRCASPTELNEKQPAASLWYSSFYEDKEAEIRLFMQYCGMWGGPTLVRDPVGPTEKPH